jgi:outer membrane protein assembly factor BamC
MKIIDSITKTLILGGLAFLQGCGSFSADQYLPDKKVEYQKSVEIGNDLELPPDLTSTNTGSELYIPGATGSAGVATYSEFLGEKQLVNRTTTMNSNVLPKVDNIALKREGNDRWLVIQSSPQIVWPNVVSFWQENGILLLEQDPTVGVMKTGWLENRADIDSDFITRNIRKVFDGIYSAATRDQYRVRLEEGDQPGTTEVYLTHFGMEEKIQTNTANEGERSIWVPRGTDPGLEAEMLRRLMVHMGVKEKRAETLVASKSNEKAKRSELIRNARETKLQIDETFARAWRLVGLSLDRVGFAVEDRDRSNGIYYVRYNDPMAGVETDEGWLSKLKFWGDSGDRKLDDRYQIQVSANDAVSEVMVLNDQGQVLMSDTAGRILTLINEQIQ